MMANGTFDLGTLVNDGLQDRSVSDWLWMVFAVMLVCNLGVLCFSRTKRPASPMLHRLAITILSTTSIAYHYTASNFGQTPPLAPSSFDFIVYNIQYVRYIQWIVNAPLLVIALFLRTGLPLSDVVLPSVMAEASVLLGLAGTFAADHYKWAYFIMSCAALFNVFGHLLSKTLRDSFPTPTGLSRWEFVVSVLSLAFIWTLYPTVWALSEGWNLISTADAVASYGIVDLLAGPVFLAYVLRARRHTHVGSVTLLSDDKV
ncbi:hypothetical protein EW146_g3046 [Bondarzewia mesenterica]|uniref:Rhodopsin n=1 Tax=Bondarzewia mesenterica TaxID=1095465 RepID=A0A4V6S1I2_9AGAM|nr:hypothetical protein EW146_g3046 [Bondarzewia mesenterica]